MIGLLASLGGFAIGASLTWAWRQRAQRAVLAQHSELLDALVGQTELALLLHREHGQVVYANPAAEALFAEGAPMVGQNMIRLVNQAPGPLREALLGENALFTVELDGGPATYQLHKTDVRVGAEPHSLWIVSHLTQEVSRREVEVLKKVIRVLGHELNNSLGSMGSLIGSARYIAGHPEHLEKLEEVLGAIEERTEHLKGFLESYATLARLPRPRKRDVAFLPMGKRLAALFPEAKLPEDDTVLHMDEAQIEQALINLLKNAHEAGGQASEVELRVESRDQGWTDLRVLDRGAGFSDEALRNALLPFYTTKVGGSGMGLALCREIAEGHGGSLGIRQREGGGTAITLRLPPREQTAPPRASLTLTRA